MDVLHVNDPCLLSSAEMHRTLGLPDPMGDGICWSRLVLVGVLVVAVDSLWQGKL